MNCDKCGEELVYDPTGEDRVPFCLRCENDDLRNLATRLDFSGKPDDRFLRTMPTIKDYDLILREPVYNRPGFHPVDWDAELKNLMRDMGCQ